MKREHFSILAVIACIGIPCTRLAAQIDDQQQHGRIDLKNNPFEDKPGSEENELLEHWDDPRYSREERLQIVISGALILGVTLLPGLKRRRSKSDAT